ncbi:MAG: hypothetical protein ACYYK0_01300 [Candidatus Eutrophobiaceae bacterium]
MITLSCLNRRLAIKEMDQGQEVETSESSWRYGLGEGMICGKARLRRASLSNLEDRYIL